MAEPTTPAPSDRLTFTARAYLWAFRNAVRVPAPLLRAGFFIGADVMWLMRGKGVRRMESNYARIRPDLDARSIRRLSRAGMRSYLRYFREAFTLHGATPEQIAARVRVENPQHVQQVFDGQASAALALGHMGNWDLAGAWATPHLAPVLTVAEKLKPVELYNEFVSFRRSLGIEVLGLGDSDVFRSLVRGAKDGHRIVPLLADRDLTASGVEVTLVGHPARVAAGPATLALTAGVDLIPLGVYYERLRGPRRRQAGNPWGIVLHFYPPIPVPPIDAAADPTLTASQRRRQQVATMTQGWVDALTDALVTHTEDWHMLQRVFVADLDPTRYTGETAT
ncbi:MAG: phosphatidylinositol mannoside acyltransferase [Cellulomonadaceae bacterium]|jgi:KDO2-lipid IV(A) lauroyltransferase|nr:phosphatidylinositol mannoside acyltransferase [Cellulomonadaceae bacterium]